MAIDNMISLALLAEEFLRLGDVLAAIESVPRRTSNKSLRKSSCCC